MPPSPPDERQAVAAFGEMVEAIPQAVVLCDMAGNVVLANTAAATLFGCPMDDLLSLHVEAFVPAASRPHHAKLRAAYAKAPVVREMAAPSSMVSALRRDGTEFWAEVSLGPTRLGNAPLVMAVIRDVSERKREEERLRDRTKRLSQVKHIARYGSWEWDANADAMAWSDGLYRLLGISREDVADPSFGDYLAYVHPADRRRVGAVVADALESAETFELEHRFVRPDGADVVVQVLGNVSRDREGRPLAILGTTRDVTREREIEEEAKREGAKWLQAAFAALDDAVFIVTADRLLVSVNHAGEKMFGYAEHELASQPTDVLHVDAAHHEEFGRIISKAFARNESAHFEFEMKRKNGETFPSEHTVSLLKNDAGEPMGIVSVVRDISERRHIEAERLEFEKRKLDSLNLLAGGIAHDFNNMLSSILSNVYVAQGDLPANAPAAVLLEDIRAAAQSAGELANQMLEYAGAGRFLAEEVDLSAVVREAWRLLEVTIPKTARIHLELDSALPTVRGDASQLRRVVMNLLLNASEALRDTEGEIRVETYRDQDTSGSTGLTKDESVILEVSDTGGGIDERTRQKIFDPFFTTKRNGRGLGLAVIQGIVRKHRGAIHVKSTPGRGATFRVRLPVERPCHAQTDEPTTSDARPRSPRKVLVVDDDQAVRQGTARVLASSGLEILTACDGAEAVEAFRRSHSEIDCILLDLRMPRMTGDQALEEIRKLSASVPVVIYSAYDPLDTGERLRRLGVSEFIEKPCHPPTLIGTLHRVMSDASEGSSTRVAPSDQQPASSRSARASG